MLSQIQARQHEVSKKQVAGYKTPKATTKIMPKQKHLKSMSTEKTEHGANRIPSKHSMEYNHSPCVLLSRYKYRVSIIKRPSTFTKLFHPFFRTMQ